jgi:hypothetical protein
MRGGHRWFVGPALLLAACTAPHGATPDPTPPTIESRIDAPGVIGREPRRGRSEVDEPSAAQSATDFSGYSATSIGGSTPPGSCWMYCLSGRK